VLVTVRSAGGHSGAGHLSVQLTKDGQHVITSSLRGPPQVRHVMVSQSTLGIIMSVVL